MCPEEPDVLVRQVARSAHSMVGERCGWATIAASYATARREHVPLRIRRAATPLAGVRSKIAIPEGNLLAI